MISLDFHVTGVYLAYSATEIIAPPLTLQHSGLSGPWSPGRGREIRTRATPPHRTATPRGSYLDQFREHWAPRMRVALRTALFGSTVHLPSFPCLMRPEHAQRPINRDWRSLEYLGPVFLAVPWLSCDVLMGVLVEMCLLLDTGVR